jgi:hypothetical protein
LLGSRDKHFSLFGIFVRSKEKSLIPLVKVIKNISTVIKKRNCLKCLSLAALLRLVLYWWLRPGAYPRREGAPERIFKYIGFSLLIKTHKY